MIVEPWDPNSHLSLMADWLRQRGHAIGAGDARLYPSTGFVVDRCAAGFIFVTNAPLVGYLDGLVTDPAAPARRRYFATRLLLDRVTDLAATLGIELLLLSTNAKGLVSVCKRAGFTAHGSGFQFLGKQVR